MSMTLPALAATLLSYAALGCLCFGLPRHHQQVFPPPAPRHRLRGLRSAGWLLLAAALLACARAWGWPVGIVAWFGLLSVASLTLVFLLPFHPRAAVLLTPVCALGGLILF